MGPPQEKGDTMKHRSSPSEEDVIVKNITKEEKEMKSMVEQHQMTLMMMNTQKSTAKGTPNSYITKGH